MNPYIKWPLVGLGVLAAGAVVVYAGGWLLAGKAVAVAAGAAEVAKK